MNRGGEGMGEEGDEGGGGCADERPVARVGRLLGEGEHTRHGAERCTVCKKMLADCSFK
jgi:hypothetical protein